MSVYRAPIQIDTIPTGDQEDKRPRTRCGYLVPEAYQCYEQALGETGAVASGRALHFAADIICSGGVEIWIRGAYSYAVQHIGIASPRIFVYLKQRVGELDKKLATLPQEAFFTNPEVQACICETVLIIQLCPKRTKVVWPKVEPTTKRNGWLRGVAGAAEAKAVRLVCTTGEDSTTMYLVGNEFCKAIEEGSTEKALFWARWLLEEDAKEWKENKAGLTTKERGPPDQNTKARRDVGYYLADLLAEMYNELASKNLVRMHEEFIELRRLHRGGEKRMAARLRKDCLGWMIMICCEVPRWKVPAAPQLVQDPIKLSRAVGQSKSFFTEVLAYKALPFEKQIKATMTRAQKQKRNKELTEKEKKDISLEDHFDAYDAAMELYLKKF
jgi:hypothetical protein